MFFNLFKTKKPKNQNTRCEDININKFHPGTPLQKQNNETSEFIHTPLFLPNNKPSLEEEKNYLIDGIDIKWEDTVKFTFPVTGGRVIKVYDGDTITIVSKLPYKDSPLYRLSVRLNGIDTPEIKGKNISNDEKNAAQNAKEFVANLVLNKYVTLKIVEDINEKYGRILADVYVNDLHINELLIKERYALKYDGGTKIKPTSWLEYKKTGKL